MPELTIDQALQQGIKAHKAGQAQEADRLYTAILKVQPKHPDANHNMGVLAVGVGKIEQALPFFKTALEANPATGQFWLSYIDALIKLEQLPSAQAVLDQAKSKGAKGDGFDQLEQRLKASKTKQFEAIGSVSKEEQTQPNILHTLKLDQAIKLAKTKTKEGALDQAKRIYQDILVRFPRNKRASDGLKALVSRPTGKVTKVQDPPQDQLQSLITLYSQGQLQQALKQANTLLQYFPESSVLHNICGAVYKGLGQLDVSIEAFNKALAIRPDYADVYNNMGNTLTIQGKLDEAIEAYNKVLAIRPDYADAYNNIGNALKKQAKPEEAIEAYNKALTIQPDYAEAYLNMGITLQEQSRLEEAIVSYNKALSIRPDYAEIYLNMGDALKEKDGLKEAIGAYKKALAIRPDYPEVYNNIGNALREQVKPEEAIEAYNKALAVKPDYAEAYNNLGVVLKEQGKIEESLEAYTKALTIKPDYAVVYNSMGVTLKEQGKIEEAIEAFNKAISIKPDYAEVYKNMGNTLKEQGKQKEAIELYNKALAIKPDYADASFNLALLLYESGQYDKAAMIFKKNISSKSQNYLLKCLYDQDLQSNFYDQLDYLINRGENNAIIGSYISRSKIRYGIKKNNPFCNNPLKYAIKVDISERCDFANIFVKGTLDILNDAAVQNKRQSLITKGVQTSGNVFNQIGSIDGKIQDIIRHEIESYQLRFKKSTEGLITNWPLSYQLRGWIVKMKNGGAIKPHMHEEGWLSGSIYINVPPKMNKDSGNLVVCVNDGLGKNENMKSLNVVTGSLCLFPSSLLHYTIPFEADEDRIVLAFDMIPK